MNSVVFIVCYKILQIFWHTFLQSLVTFAVEVISTSKMLLPLRESTNFLHKYEMFVLVIRRDLKVSIDGFYRKAGFWRDINGKAGHFGGTFGKRDNELKCGTPGHFNYTKIYIICIPKNSNWRMKLVLLLCSRLRELDEHDRARLAQAKAKNSLESFIVETRDKLYRDEYEKATTEEERNNMQQKLSEVGDWLEYESDDATTEIFKTKLNDLKKLTKDMFERVKEHQDRPEALKALKEMINISQVFLASARNVSEDDQIFTEVELKTLENLIADTHKWLTNTLQEQNALPLSQAPKMTIKSIGEKVGGLDREVKYLLNKARFAQPLKKKVDKEKKANETAQNATQEKIIPANATEAEIKDGSESTVKPLVIPDLADSSTEEPKVTTGEENITPSPSAETKKDDDHSEL